MPARHHTKSVEFRDIAGDEGYQVGDDGSVRSLWGMGAQKPGAVWRFLKPCVSDKSGHLSVVLRKRRHVQVHTLVLEEFVGPCPDGLECRHLDGCSNNNNLWNLAWGTHAENMQDCVRHGTHVPPRINGENHPQSKLTENDVREIRKIYSNGILSQKEICEKFCICQVNISAIVRRKIWKNIE